MFCGYPTPGLVPGVARLGSGKIAHYVRLSKPLSVTAMLSSMRMPPQGES